MLYNHESPVDPIVTPHHITMKSLVRIFFLLTKCSVLLAALTYGQDEDQNGKIVGGHEAIPHSHPYLVSLQLRLLWVRTHICGGTLLNENWVLTAGHCIKESWIIRWLPMDAVAGAHNVDNYGPSAQVVSIDKRIAHPSYNGGIGPNDIAMLKTRTPFTFTKEIQPLRLPVDYKIKPHDLTLTGWGVLRTTWFIPILPSKLQEVQVSYLPYEECYRALEDMREPYEANPLDKDANICTGPLTGGIAACNGDSGGPLVQFSKGIIENITNDPVDEDKANNNDYTDIYDNDEDYRNPKKEESEENLPVLLGVVSWGVSPCGEKGGPTVYTKVSRYLDFINENINT